jgi:hypothetical protein
MLTLSGTSYILMNFSPILIFLQLPPEFGTFSLAPGFLAPQIAYRKRKILLSDNDCSHKKGLNLETHQVYVWNV